MFRIYRFAILAMLAAVPALAVEPVDRLGAMQQRASQQRMEGKVIEVDPRTGFVTMSSTQGALKLHFPPQVARELKFGDTITAYYAFTKDAGPEALPEDSTRAFDAPKAFGEQRMNGTVSAVDEGKGWIKVRTEAGMLHLRFPSEALKTLKQGDQIIIDLGFTKDS